MSQSERSPQAARPIPQWKMGDRLRLRKPHPCGGDEWEVVRLGADIGLRCTTCGRRILLARATLERRLRSVLPVRAEGEKGAE